LKEQFYLYIGLVILFLAVLQLIFGVAVYFSIFSAFTGGRIVKREKEPNEFKTAVVIQVVTGCFFILLEILFNR
jgi:hypothetical protein